MAKKKNKRPHAEEAFLNSLAKKEPRVGFDVEHYRKENPVWQIGKVDDGGKWGWRTIGKDRWENDILPKLKNFESMTWAEIEQASGGRSSGNNSHFINRDGLAKEAQKRLEELKLDDIDQVFSLRLSGKTRVIGKRIGRVMQIMWFDFNHEVCQSEKKHT